jgi:uncharacterized protein DUF1376
MITALNDPSVSNVRARPSVRKEKHRHRQEMTLHEWLLRYPPVWSMYTGHMACTERGAVWTLILHYYKHGNIPSNDADLAAALGISVEEWRPIADDVLIGYGKIRQYVRPCKTVVRK